MEKITIGVVNYNGRNCLPGTLGSVNGLEYNDFDVIIVDNASNDGSREWAQKNYPQYRIVSLNMNIGPAGAKSVILKEAKTRLVFIIDNDIEVTPNCLSQLMKIVMCADNVGLCHPEIRDDRDPMAYHYNGGWIHYLCAFISRPDPTNDVGRSKYENFDVVSGAAILVDRIVALKIGGFDEDFFFNWEDGDFASRMTLAGYDCLNVPKAVVHHRSKPRGTSKVYYQVRNRWYFILKLYDFRTILLILPMLCLFEFAQLLFMLKNGSIIDYWKGNCSVIKDLPKILTKRKFFRKLKKKKDKDWLRSGQIYIPKQVNAHSRVICQLQGMFFGLCNRYWEYIESLC